MSKTLWLLLDYLCAWLLRCTFLIVYRLKTVADFLVRIQIVAMTRWSRDDPPEWEEDDY